MITMGVDAGGTSSTAVLYNGSEVHAMVQGGPGNMKRIGYDGVVALVASLFEQLQAIAPTQPIERIGIGLAGAGKPEEQTKLRSLLMARFSLPCTVATDAAIALHGAFDGAAGMLLIAGTGSIAYGRNRLSKQPERVGGWGWQVGDEGSGSWLGREAVRCALLAEDGRGDETALSPTICAALSIATITDCIPLIYSTEWSAQRYGEIAPLVLETAKEDYVARRLVRLAASHLAKHLVVLQQKLGGEAQVRDVVFSGGLIANDTLLRQELLTELDHIGTFSLTTAVYSPAVGAARMAGA